MAEKYTGKFLKKDSELVPSDFSKPKSQQDLEKIKAAQDVLAKYKPILEELSQASLDILTGTIMQPIHKKLEQIQVVTEAKKQMKSAIEEIRTGEIKKLEDFEEAVTSPKNTISNPEHTVRSSDLDSKVSNRNLATLARTNFAAARANLAKSRYSVSATYYALIGQEDHRDIALGQARAASKNIMDKMSKKNETYTKETQDRIDTFNRVERKTDNEHVREVKAQTIDKMTSDFLKRNSHHLASKGVSLALSLQGNSRRFTGNLAAQLVENTGNYLGRQAALHGLHELADFVSQATVDTSDHIMNRAGQKNKKLYQKLDRRTEAYDKSAEVSKSARETVDRLSNTSKANIDDWEKNQSSSGFTTRIGMKPVKVINKASTFSNKLISKSGIKLTEYYAKGASVIGFTEHAKNVMEQSKQKSFDRMARTETSNEAKRQKADRVFAFKDRRKQDAKDIAKALAKIGTGIGKGFEVMGEELSESFSELSTNIQTRTEQAAAKKRYLSGHGGMESLQRNSKLVLSKVAPSLESEVPVAAQTDIPMNPGRKKQEDHDIGGK